eukprot:m51a1_g5173 hypothetical protein (482) ;mRNA; r:145267-147155
MTRPLCILALVALACGATETGRSLTEFHNIFTSHLQRNNPRLSETRLRSSLMFPTPELVEAHGFSDLGAVDAAFARVKPSDCKRVEEGKAPVTIVSLNGMAGEFVPRPALSTAYNATSTFALAYKKMLRNYPSLTVPVWDNRVLSDIEVPLGHVVMAGSFDAPDGTPLYNIVFFIQREGSLESLYEPDYVVPRIIQRMSLFLDLVGSYVDDFVLVGFSRGAIDALYVMARHATIPWGNRIRGVITLDGVVYGTSLGDCGLGETTSNPPSLCETINNGMAWIELLYNGLVPKLTHVIQNTALLTRSFNELIRDMLFDFDLLHPVLGYDDNILRLKNVIGGVLTSMRLLSTKTRTEWWANHTLPTDRLYASFTGTMADFDYTYPEVHPDEWAMRYLYYVTAQASGQELVDGPVQSARQIILPNVHRGLNPHQEPYEAHWLGLFHTTHAGAVLDHAVPCPDNWVDPFPRKTLVDSFATWIATHN